LERLDYYLRRAKKLIDEVNTSKKRIPPYHYLDPRRKPHYLVIMEWLKRHVSREDSILEVGCGIGLFGTWLRLEGYKNYTGVDIAKIQVDVGKLVDQENNLLCMDGCLLHFSGASFDFAGFINCFFNELPPRFIQEGLRVARKYAEWDGYDLEELKRRGDTTLKGYRSLPSRMEVLTWLKGRNVVLDKMIPPDRHIYIVKIEGES